MRSHYIYRLTSACTPLSSVRQLLEDLKSFALFLNCITQDTYSDLFADKHIALTSQRSKTDNPLHPYSGNQDESSEWVRGRDDVSSEWRPLCGRFLSSSGAALGQIVFQARQTQASHLYFTPTPSCEKQRIIWTEYRRLRYFGVEGHMAESRICYRQFPSLPRLFVFFLCHKKNM